MQAEENMCFQIKAYAEYYGATTKFNKTVTVASVKLLSYYILMSKSTDFKGLIIEFPEVLSNFKTVLTTYYSYNVFADIDAKKEFKAPDLMPFPALRSNEIN